MKKFEVGGGQKILGSTNVWRLATPLHVSRQGSPPSMLVLKNFEFSTYDFYF